MMRMRLRIEYCNSSGVGSVALDSTLFEGPTTLM